MRGDLSHAIIINKSLNKKPSLNKTKIPTHTPKMQRIQEHFNGRTILLTGPMGLNGQCTIEKILFDTPEIEKLYIVIRAKKNMTPFDRYASTLLNSTAFTRLRARHGDQYKEFMASKIKVLDGDLQAKNLGLSEDDIEDI